MGRGGLWRQFSSLWADRSGGIFVTVALVTPVVAVLLASAIDLAMVTADKNGMQNVADSAVLAAAKELGLTDISAVQSRAASYVDDGMSKFSDVSYQVTTSAPADASTLTVAIAGTRTSYFANLLPPGGWHFSATATAVRLAKAPLCIISSGQGANNAMSMTDTATINAPGCFVQVNSDLALNKSAALAAMEVQTSGLASGNVTPTAQTGAKPLDDPFSNTNVSTPGALCNPLDVLVSVGVTVLGPGVHCGNITAGNSATLTLLPGEHYFAKGNLSLKNSAVLSGTDVVLIFDDNSSFKAYNKATISLEGRKSGALAGFVMATTRTNTNQFEISSDSARKLLGTVYVPNATLYVSGTGKVADQSAWTVVVAKAIKMDGSPTLVINSDYSGSSVPVPGGVGSRANNVWLKQ